MKNLILFTLIISSCSFSVTNNYLLSKSKFLIDTSISDAYYTIIPTYKIESKKFIDSIKNNFPFSFNEKLIGRTKYDSTKKISIFFNNIDQSKFYPFLIYNWDHVNFRFLFPPLLLFQKNHIHNKCIGNAINQCVLYNADGINMGNELYNFQLLKKK